MQMKEESERAGLQLIIKKKKKKKTKITASDPITSWQIEGERWKSWQISSSWALKSLWMVTAAVKSEEIASGQ